MAKTDDLLSLELPCDVCAPVVVRNALTEVHDGCWSLDDGRLVASELVGNAVRHSGGAGGHRLEITVGLRDGRLLISVHDPGTSGPAQRPAADDPSQAGGWGLWIIGELAETWGAERPEGYRVWAELPAYT